MDRITFEGNFCDIAMCRESPCPYNGMCSQRETWERLKKYEDAEQAGQLVVLPCKVGDSVYIPDLDKKIPVMVRVQGISISVSGRTILHFGGYPVECAWGDGCGKDWFLTREEAEAALAQKGGESDA